MKKSLYILSALSVLLVFPATNLSATVINKLEAKRNEGNATSVVYEYKWELVYGAARYISRHSENSCIAKQYGQFHTDYAVDEKAIYKYSKKSGLGIFLVPLNAEQTRVDFAYVGLTGNLKCSIDAYLKELPYLLKHNSKTVYREYTRKLREEREKELERSRGGIQ
jgi:hypothetical protein